jgi:hypothetical protein
MVQLILAVVVAVVVVDQMIMIDQIEMQHDIFLNVYSLYHSIDQIFFVENNQVLVHVVIFNYQTNFLFMNINSTYRDSRPCIESNTFDSGNLSPCGNELNIEKKFNLIKYFSRKRKYFETFFNYFI